MIAVTTVSTCCDRLALRGPFGAVQASCVQPLMLPSLCTSMVEIQRVWAYPQLVSFHIDIQRYGFFSYSSEADSESEADEASDSLQSSSSSPDKSASW